MKRLEGAPFDQWRDRSPDVYKHYGTFGDHRAGVFRIPPGILAKGKDAGIITVIASSGEGWDHVSVSLPHRCPTWEEMVEVKRVFFRRTEWALELHPPQSKNISVHDYCLHLWRPHDMDIPVPPPDMVG